jgi:hypothetical protein
MYTACFADHMSVVYQNIECRALMLSIPGAHETIAIESRHDHDNKYYVCTTFPTFVTYYCPNLSHAIQLTVIVAIHSALIYIRLACMIVTVCL